MGFVLAIAQTGFPTDEDVLAHVEASVRKAANRGAQLVAFPENLMYPRELTAAQLARLAEPLDGPFVRGLLDIAKAHDLWIAFTTSEADPEGGLPYNTAAVASPTGSLLGTYRKCHLYDAHQVRESDRMAAGSRLCEPIRTPFCTLGIGICYDLRFPELARSLALQGCELLLFPAAWHDGPQKLLHWRTLLRARAIENECFVAGICHAGERYVGCSYAFDPLGNELVAGTDDVLTCDIEPTAIRSARDAMPVFSHRRPELYGKLV